MDGVRRIECTLYMDDLSSTGPGAGPDREEVVHFIHSLLDAIEGAYPQAHVMVTEVGPGARAMRSRPGVRVECEGDGGSVCRQITELVNEEARRHFGSRGRIRFVA